MLLFYQHDKTPDINLHRSASMERFVSGARIGQAISAGRSDVPVPENDVQQSRSVRDENYDSTHTTCCQEWVGQEWGAMPFAWIVGTAHHTAGSKA